MVGEGQNQRTILGDYTLKIYAIGFSDAYCTANEKISKIEDPKSKY